MQKTFQILRWCFLSSVIFCLTFLANQMHEEQIVYLKEINIEESDFQFITRDIILDYIESHTFDFDSVLLSSFDLNLLEKILLNHPAIKNVDVYINQEGLLGINIQPRTAIVRFKNSIVDYYLDEDGREMPLSENYTARVLVVSGDISPLVHSKVLDFLQIVNQNNFWKSQIVQLNINRDEVVIIPRIGNHKIYFGGLSEIKEKLENLYQFYKQVMPLKGWQTYSEISLKYNQQIVCTKRE